MLSPARQLSGFIAKFDPRIAALARAVLARLRSRLPAAHRLVYDNYNALVVGFCSNDRASGVIVSMGVYPRWLNLYFFDPDLPDPHGLLKGNGSMVRRIQITDAALIDSPAVKALIAHAVKITEPRLAAKGRGRLIIKAVSKKQRPRRAGTNSRPQRAPRTQRKTIDGSFK